MGIHPFHFKGVRMTITEVEVGLTDSFKVDNYQYIKPELRIKAKIEEGEDPKEVIDRLEKYISKELKSFIDHHISMKENHHRSS